MKQINAKISNVVDFTSNRANISYPQGTEVGLDSKGNHFSKRKINTRENLKTTHFFKFNLREHLVHIHEKMYLMYYLDTEGKRVYTLAKVDPSGKPTFSAHPARFSPEDQYSRQRITVKRRFGLLPTQQPAIKY